MLTIDGMIWYNGFTQNTNCLEVTIMKHITKLLVIATLACAMLLCACSASPKTFIKDGMSITLTNKFSESTQEGFTVVYASMTEGVMVTKESFDSLAAVNITADSTLTDYANIVISANSLTNIEVKTASDNKVTYFTYESTVDGVSYSYVATVFKGTNAFWLIQFSSTTENFNAEMQNTFLGYAASVTVE